MKYHCQFLLDKEKGKKDARLRYRIKWGKNIVAFNIGYRVDVEKWSLETQRCINNTTHGKKKISASIINRKIQMYERVVEDLIYGFSLSESIPNKEEFKNLFNQKIGKEKKIKSKKSFFEAFDEYIVEESTKKQWTYGTKKMIKSVKNHLYKFKNDIKFEEINEKFLYEYLEYLNKFLKFKNTTTKKKLTILKSFLDWSLKKGYVFNDDYKNFSPTIKNTDKKIIFLTPTEFKKLREFEIPANKKYLEKIKDVFLFLCFTGLRYSDVANLKKGDIKNDKIEITTVKTNNSIVIELNNYSKKILSKYKDFNLKNNKALPVISNQKMNRYLKELSKLVGIDEPVREVFYIGGERHEEIFPKYALIGTHAGRRTFICNALSLGIPPQVIMKWTGHSDYKSMKPYIDIADETKATAMEKFNNL